MPTLRRTATFAFIAVALLVPTVLVATVFNVAGFARGGSFGVQLWWLMILALFPLFWLHRGTKISSRLVIWLVAVSLGVISMFAAQRIGFALFVQDLQDFNAALNIITISWLIADAIAVFAAMKLNQWLTKSVAQEH
jgi:hypothetical protein